MDRDYELRIARREYAIHKGVVWAGRILGLTMIVGGVIEQTRGEDGRFLMMGGALVEFGAYVLHPYKAINRSLKERIEQLER